MKKQKKNTFGSFNFIQLDNNNKEKDQEREKMKTISIASFGVVGGGMEWGSRVFCDVGK